MFLHLYLFGKNAFNFITSVSPSLFYCPTVRVLFRWTKSAVQCQHTHTDTRTSFVCALQLTGWSEGREREWTVQCREWGGQKGTKSHRCARSVDLPQKEVREGESGRIGCKTQSEAKWSVEKIVCLFNLLAAPSSQHFWYLPISFVFAINKVSICLQHEQVCHKVRVSMEGRGSKILCKFHACRAYQSKPPPLLLSLIPFLVAGIIYLAQNRWIPRKGEGYLWNALKTSFDSLSRGSCYW